jgi:2-C-methyl-D-erythritol 4-phosphate cytidylyltransferase
MSTEPLWCVVPAAGSGLRFGGSVPKQYMSLRGRPLLVLTLERLAASDVVGGLVVVLARDDAHWPGVSRVGGKPVRVATGADQRSGSVLAGLRALPDSVASDAFVLVHDAARPCVEPADIERLVRLGMPAGGALLAAPLRDTLKRAGGGSRVLETEPRESRWRALTPQLFRRGELESALADAARTGVAITDESMAMERAGHHPLLVEGAETNLKVTTRADLVMAEMLLKRGMGNGE